MEEGFLEEDFEELGAWTLGGKGKGKPEGIAGAKAQKWALGFLL